VEIQSAIFIAATVLIGMTIWEARRSQQSEAARTVFLRLWGLVLIAFVGYVLLSYLTALSMVTQDPTAAERFGTYGEVQRRGLFALGLAGAAAVWLWLLVFDVRFRRPLLRLFPRPQPSVTSEPDHVPRPWVRGFDPHSPVHALALALALLFFLQSVIDYILAGGQSGLAATDLSQTGLVISAALTALMLLVSAFAGVGVGQDRSWKAAIERLGLHRVGFTEITVGAGVAVMLLVFQFSAAIVWMLFVPQNVIEQQTELSRAITGSVTSLTAAFLVASFSSLGEEIAFRGALQPVLGLWPTAVLFALTHIQYQFTPAALIIFVVGLVLGWTRHYFGTVAAIAAHFLYNFSLLTLAIFASRFVGG